MVGQDGARLRKHPQGREFVLVAVKENADRILSPKKAAMTLAFGQRKSRGRTNVNMTRGQGNGGG